MEMQPTAATLACAMVLLLRGRSAQPADYSQRRCKSTVELALTVEQLAGSTCSETERDDQAHTNQSLAMYGWAFLPCSNGSVTVVASNSKRAELAHNTGNTLNPSYCQLEGGSWSIWGQHHNVQAAQKAMQGTITCA